MIVGAYPQLRKYLQASRQSFSFPILISPFASKFMVLISLILFLHNCVPCMEQKLVLRFSCTQAFSNPFLCVSGKDHKENCAEVGVCGAQLQIQEDAGH